MLKERYKFNVKVNEFQSETIFPQRDRFANIIQYDTAQLLS